MACMVETVCAPRKESMKSASKSAIEGMKKSPKIKTAKIRPDPMRYVGCLRRRKNTRNPQKSIVGNRESQRLTRTIMKMESIDAKNEAIT